MIEQVTAAGLESYAGAAQGRSSRDLQRARLQDEGEKDLVRAQYFSPVVKLDVDTQTAVLVYRDYQTGEVQRQYPAEVGVGRYARSSGLGEAGDGREAAPAGPAGPGADTAPAAHDGPDGPAFAAGPPRDAPEAPPADPPADAKVEFVV